MSARNRHCDLLSLTSQQTVARFTVQIPTAELCEPSPTQTACRGDLLIPKRTHTHTHTTEAKPKAREKNSGQVNQRKPRTDSARYENNVSKSQSVKVHTGTGQAAPGVYDRQRVLLWQSNKSQLQRTERRHQTTQQQAK